MHGSPPNPSNDRRIGFAIRYIPTSVRQLAGEDSATLVRGVDTYHHFEPEPRPARDMDPAFVDCTARSPSATPGSSTAAPASKPSTTRALRGSGAIDSRDDGRLLAERGRLARARPGRPRSRKGDPVKTYVGGRSLDGAVVTVDGKPLPPRYDLKRLSPAGFEWTYEGAGPAQLSLALLADHFG